MRRSPRATRASPVRATPVRATPALVVLSLLALGAARGAGAQARVQLRADALLARATAVQGGVGVETDAGLYARVGAVAGVGADRDGVSGRVEGVARFVLDPLRQSRRGPYLGGGAGVSRDGRGDTHAYLLAVIGVEGGAIGGARRGWAPAVEVGLGGGARLALVLRRARPDAR